MAKIIVKHFNLYYTDFHALKDINVTINENRITAMIGPSGCGKSTFLRSINRINDTIDGVKTNGQINVLGQDIYNNKVNINTLRRDVGMVFQRPNPFPISIYENVAFGLRVNRLATKKKMIDVIVEKSLRDVLLWDDIKDKLYKSALNLTLEQQQRLCIARVLAVAPHIILLDESCSVLDPGSVQRIEELMLKLKDKYTIIMVTHNMQQAARISHDTIFMLSGTLVEFNATKNIFSNPMKNETKDYISGKYG
jgi:phosphate transport system ATP-binding protein